MAFYFGETKIPSVKYTTVLADASLTSGNATPTTSTKTFYPPSGSSGFSSFTVNAIQTQTKTVTSNGTYSPDNGKFFSSFTVNVPIGDTINSEEITINPSETEQVITPSNGHNAIIQVTVNPVSSTYVGSGIPRNSQNSLTASGATVTVPAGYYATSASKSVASGTAGTPTATKGTVSNHQVSITPAVTNTAGYIASETKTGTAITVSASELVSGNKSITENGSGIDVTNYKTVSVNVISDAPAEMTLPTSASSTQVGTNKATINRSTSAQYINIPIGYNSTSASYTISATPNMTLPTAVANSASGNSNKLTFTPTTANKYINIPTGYNTTASYYTLKGDSNLKAENIKSGVTIFGINGSYTAPTGLDTSDATALATDILSNKTAYVNGSKITGTMTNNGQTGGTITSQSGTYTIPAGYTTGGTVTANISSGSTTVSGSASASSATITTGNGTLTLTKSVSITPTVNAGYISSGTQGSVNISLTASVTTKAAATITPSTSNQTIASGTYLIGTQTIAGDADLVAGNIKSGVSIFGVTGTYSHLNTNDGAASASDINIGKIAYVNGEEIVGEQVINRYYTGSSAPASSLGSNGDIYFQE